MHTIPTTSQSTTTRGRRCGRVLPGSYWALAGVLMAVVAMSTENLAGVAAVVLFCAVPLAARFVHDLRASRSDGPQDAPLS